MRCVSWCTVLTHSLRRLLSSLSCVILARETFAAALWREGAGAGAGGGVASSSHEIVGVAHFSVLAAKGFTFYFGHQTCVVAIGTT